MITTGDLSKIHWNYFLALERDLEILSRYVEFAENNFQVYSIELARLLFAAASEVEVVAKALCIVLEPASNPSNINGYRKILVEKLPDLARTEVFVHRYSLSYAPWSSWVPGEDGNPAWWRAYNNVKHQRDRHFDQANLQHALNAMGGLLVLMFHLYSRTLGANGVKLSAKETTAQFTPKSTLLKLHPDFYHLTVVV